MRSCLDCGSLAVGTRCAACAARQARQSKRPSASARGYGFRWRELSKLARRLQPFCSSCGATEDLTLDHRIALSRGGTRRPTLGDVTVLCRRCNSRKGTRIIDEPNVEQLTLDAPGVPPRGPTP